MTLLHGARCANRCTLPESPAVVHDAKQDGSGTVDQYAPQIHRMLHKAEEWRLIRHAPKLKLMKEYGRSLRLDDEAEKKLLAGAHACNWRKRSLQLFRDIIILTARGASLGSRAKMSEVCTGYVRRIGAWQWARASCLRPDNDDDRTRVAGSDHCGHEEDRVSPDQTLLDERFERVSVPFELRLRNGMNPPVPEVTVLIHKITKDRRAGRIPTAHQERSGFQALAQAAAETHAVSPAMQGAPCGCD